MDTSDVTTPVMDPPFREEPPSLPEVRDGFIMSIYGICTELLKAVSESMAWGIHAVLGPKGLQLLWHQTAQFNRQGSLSHSSETYPRLHTKALETGAVPH